MIARRFTSRPGIGVALMLALVAVANCAPRPGEDVSWRAVGTDNTGPAVSADLKSILDAATRDAASRLNVDPGAVEVTSVRQVNWSDGSLGCPVEGMLYTQALVPGYRVILRAGGQTFDYHAAANGHFVLCPPGRAIDPVPDQPT